MSVGAEEAPFICGAGVNTLKRASGMSSVFVINNGLMDAAILGASCIMGKKSVEDMAFMQEKIREL